MKIEFLNIDGYQVQQHQKELDFIISKAKGKKNYMEIGIFGGGTFNYVSKFVKGKHIALDMMANKERDEKLKKTVKNCHIVIGNSHSYDTLSKVQDILNGELLDVLFIDGDHSAEGVQQDFEMYKHLVSEKGVILFHDIVKSDFHALHKCFVDQFWDIAPEPKESVCVSDVWGGVGCITNNKVNWECYQIYFNDENKKKLNSIFTPYNNEKDKSFFFFENNVIIDIYKKLDKIDADYVGTCSYQFDKKTKLTEARFKELVEATNNNYDVILFPYKSFTEENCIKRNKKYYTDLYQLSEIIDRKNILPFKITNDKWTCSYCNFWIAKKEVYKDYCKKVLSPIMNLMISDKEIKKYIKNNKFKYKEKDYPLAPFILELLMGFYVNYFNIPHTVITKQREFPTSNKRSNEVKFVKTGTRFKVIMRDNHNKIIENIK